MVLPIRTISDIDDHRQPLVMAVYGEADKPRLIHSHRHARGQLLMVASGLVTVRTGRGSWVVPADSAFWLPADCEHSLQLHGGVTGWFVYVAPPACDGLGARLGTARTAPLLRAAIARLCNRQWSEANAPAAAVERLEAVVLDEIAALDWQDAYLPMPMHRPMQRLAELLTADPADNRPLEELALKVGLSRRSVTRRFHAETGLSFTVWRQRLRLIRAIEMLTAGASVTDTAMELGYDSLSAFTAMFRRNLGVAPMEYLGRRAAAMPPGGAKAPPPESQAAA